MTKGAPMPLIETPTGRIVAPPNMQNVPRESHLERERRYGERVFAWVVQQASLSAELDAETEAAFEVALRFRLEAAFAEHCAVYSASLTWAQFMESATGHGIVVDVVRQFAPPGVRPW